MRKIITLGLAALTLASAGAAVAQPRPYGDRDRDGIPNAVDPHNNNYGARPLGDKDHDGIPNAVDPRDDRWDPAWGRVVAPPRYWGRRIGWNRHVGACLRTYRSYNPGRDSYYTHRRWIRCTL